MREFFARHKKAIERIADVFLISVVLFFLAFLLLYVVPGLFNDVPDREPARTLYLQFALALLFTSLTVWSGFSGAAIGSLSFFQSNLAKTKRIILLVVCLLPIAFTLLEVLTGIPENRWATVQLGIYSSAVSWIFNAPAIIVGKHISTVLSDITRKVKSAFGKCSA